jgi:hypothetical protein
MAELTLVEAVNNALHTELARDASVMVIGEDVGRAGGVFRATAGLLDRFGADRCVDTPLAEAGILGSAIGLCMAGWRPVVEMQYDAFSYPSLNQLITHVGRYRWRSGGRMEFPITIRMPYGGGVRAPELHDDSPETYYVHTPGIKVAIPSTPADAKGLLAAAIRDPDPVVIFEPKLVYRTARGEVPEGEHIVPRGRGRHTRRLVRGDRHPLAASARRGDDPRVGCEDRPRRDRARGAAHGRFRRGDRRGDRREGDFRPARADPARHRLRRAVPVLDDRGRVHAVRGPGGGGGAEAALSERLRLWMERARGGGYRLRDAATGDEVRWEDDRLRVVVVAGVSFRADDVRDASFDPGRRLALVREPDNEHDPNAIGIWNQERTLQAGYVPRDVAPTLAGDELAVSLWRAGAGLRVLIVPAGSWVGTPRR